MREYNRRPERVRRTAHRKARLRAAERDIPFTITVEDIPEVPSHCPALGIPMAQGDSSGGRTTAPCLDRLVPAFGYVPGNIIWISHLANAIKAYADVREIYAVADWLHEEYKKRGYPCPTPGAVIASKSEG